jgi:hypothetical protein
MNLPSTSEIGLGITNGIPPAFVSVGAGVVDAQLFPGGAGSGTDNSRGGYQSGSSSSTYSGYKPTDAKAQNAYPNNAAVPQYGGGYGDTDAASYSQQAITSPPYNWSAVTTQAYNEALVNEQGLRRQQKQSQSSFYCCEFYKNVFICYVNSLLACPTGVGFSSCAIGTQACSSDTNCNRATNCCCPGSSATGPDLRQGFGSGSAFGGSGVGFGGSGTGFGGSGFGTGLNPYGGPGLASVNGLVGTGGTGTLNCVITP